MQNKNLERNKTKTEPAADCLSVILCSTKHGRICRRTPWSLDFQAPGTATELGIVKWVTFNPISLTGFMYKYYP